MGLRTGVRLPSGPYPEKITGQGIVLGRFLPKEINTEGNVLCYACCEMEKKMKLKKLAAVCVWVGLFVVLALLASGCSASSDDSEHAQTQAQDGADSEKDSAAAETENNNAASQDEEPALSEEAKGLLQFSPIKKGETYAIIKVKGYGSMTFKFFKAEAPKAVENFIALTKEDYYDGVTFHRVLEDFMIQGGDPTGTGSGGRKQLW